MNLYFNCRDGQSCDPTSDSTLSENCRFWPDPKANDMIDSSLMHFHWMESVTHFCDEKTHKKDVPNRQNLYCNYKSVMETIMSSPDAKTVTGPLDYVKGLTKKITKTTEHPALYVLLDHGLFPFDVSERLFQIKTLASLPCLDCINFLCVDTDSGDNPKHEDGACKIL